MSVSVIDIADVLVRQFAEKCLSWGKARFIKFFRVRHVLVRVHPFLTYEFKLRRVGEIISSVNEFIVPIFPQNFHQRRERFVKELKRIDETETTECEAHEFFGGRGDYFNSGGVVFIERFDDQMRVVTP